MTARDGRFAAGALLLTLLVPGLLLATSPFGEERATLGTLAGWGAALAIMVPSYVLLTRTVHADPHRFLRGFMLGTLLRLILTVVAVLVFVTQVEHAPVRAFVLSFFLGYMLLTGLELTLALRRGRVSA
jgi:hypothetical protein